MADLTVSNVKSILQSGATEKLFQEAPQVTSQVHETRDLSFSDFLKDSFDKANLYQNQADTAIKELVAGRNKNIHETMLTIERADTSLKLMMQVRNKILEAYREIMRMQV